MYLIHRKTLKKLILKKLKLQQPNNSMQYTEFVTHATQGHAAGTYVRQLGLVQSAMDALIGRGMVKTGMGFRSVQNFINIF